MRRLSVVTFAGALMALPCVEPFAAQLQCACQQMTTCGADACDPAPMDICSSADIGLSVDEPAIRLCVLSDCLEGPARRIDISEAVVALEDRYTSKQTPEAAPSAVFSVLDLETGIGLVQSSDEQAVVQYALVCELPAPD